MRKIAISDIHGCAKQLDELLKKVHVQPQELYFLGDYVDGGPDSVEVLQTVQQLSTQGATVLKGNHDQLLLDWLAGTEEVKSYIGMGGLKTVNSFLTYSGHQPVDAYMLAYRGSIEKKVKQTILSRFRKELLFLKSCPLYATAPGLIFVHAGIDPEKGLAGTSPYQFTHIREQFFYHYRGEETVVFGHTRAKKIHGMHDVYFGPNRVIGIDGGCAYGGQLNALIIDEKGYHTTSVPGRKIQ